MGTKICRADLWPLTVRSYNTTSVLALLTTNKQQSELSWFQSFHDIKKTGFSSSVTMEQKLFCSNLKLFTTITFLTLPYHFWFNSCTPVFFKAHKSFSRLTGLFQDHSWFKSFLWPQKRPGLIPLVPKEHNFFFLFLKVSLEFIFIFLQKTSPG